MKALLDNNLSSRLAVALNELVLPEGHQVRHLTHMFAPDAPDVEWLSALGDDADWIVISEDRRIYRNLHEREAWRQAGLTIFFLATGWHHLSNLEKAWRLIRWWSRIVEQAMLVQPPAAFEIPLRYSNGRFKQLKL